MVAQERAKNRTYAFLAVASATLGAVLALAALARSPSEALPSTWKGYRLLLVDESVPDQAILDSLSRQGITDVLAASTEPVMISNWSGLETISLAQALVRLIPGDPRRDSYIDRIGSWFQARAGGRPYRVYYLRTFPFSEAQIGLKALSPFAGKFIYPDSQSGGFLLPLQHVSGLAAMALILIYSLHSSFASWRNPGSKAIRRLALRLILVFPWLLLAAKGRSASAIGLLWAVSMVEMAGSLDFPLEELRRYHDPLSALKSLLRGGRPPLTALIVAIGAVSLSPAHAIAALAALTASASLLFGYCCLAAMDSRVRRGRRLDFVPITIGRRDRMRDQVAAALCVLALIFLAGLRLLPAGGSQSQASDIELPLPVTGIGKPEHSMDIARAPSTRPEALPGQSEWLAHRAFQEAIPLTRLKEDRPDPFAAVSLGGRAPGGISLRFDEAWRASVLRSVPANSIERMLLSQGGEVRGVLLPWSPSRPAPLAPIEGLLYILLLVPPLRRIAAGAVATRSSPTGEIRQAA